MKFALLVKRAVFVLLISSLLSPNVLAANQPDSTSKSQPASIVTINKSKLGTNLNTASTSAPGRLQIKLQQPPLPTSTASNSAPIAANKSKQSGAAPPNVTPESEQLVLQSKDLGSFGPQWQSFSDYLRVPKGCDQIPLFIIFQNGSSTGIPFQDLRITLAGKPLGTIKDFSGKVLTRNLTGALGVGDSLLTVQAFGPMGAKLKWKFVTQKIIVSKVNPNSFGPTDKVIIEGRNFSDRSGVTQVLIGDKTATIISAKTNSIQITPPSGLAGGKVSLVVAIGPLRSTPVQVTITGAPEVEGVNAVSTAPGQPITITGKGFSTNIAENVVTINGVAAEVTGCSSTSIQCIVPMALDALSPLWYAPIKVKTNGIESKETENPVTINIQSRVFGNERL